jgi:hypothetical protein
MRLYRQDDIPIFCALNHFLAHLGKCGLQPTHPTEGYKMVMFPCKAWFKDPCEATCVSITKKELLADWQDMFVRATGRKGPFGMHTGKKTA